MIIVGGTYIEATVDPSGSQVCGSGLRAAGALASVGRIELVTCVDGDTLPFAESVAATYGVGLRVVERTAPISFSYYTPLAPPVIDGLGQVVREITASDAAALVFGMLEAEPRVSAGGIVYDPQQPRGAGPLRRERLDTKRLAIVGNADEIRSLGQQDDVREAARKLVREAQAETVVIKRGALGALVVEADGRESAIGPYRTERVWPIGSGDVFSAVFAWAWLEGGRPVVDAARLASAASAFWCWGRSLPVPLHSAVVPEELGAGVALRAREQPVRVYLAGPFFDVASRWLLELVRQALEHQGASVFSPLHHVGRGSDDVAKRDIEGLERSETVFALLDHADPGTLFEIGYATARRMPVVGFAAEPGIEAYKMARGLGCLMIDDLSTAVYQAIWVTMVA